MYPIKVDSTDNSNNDLKLLHKSCLKNPSKNRTPSQEFDLKKVFFDEVSIREYPVILGDNPAVSGGVPVTIGWDVQNEYTMTVNFYEHSRETERQTNRKKLRISPKRRITVLLAAGYNFQDIADAIMKAIKIRNQRLDSLRASSLFGNGNNDTLNFLINYSLFEKIGSATKAICVLGLREYPEKGVNTVVSVGAGVVDTTGSAFKAMDVLGVWPYAEKGLSTVVGVGNDVTDQTKNLFRKSSKLILDGVTAAVGGGSVRVKPDMDPVIEIVSSSTPAC